MKYLLRLQILVVAVLGAVFAASCAQREAPREPGPTRVVCSIPPLVGLVRPLLAEDAEVAWLVPPGSSVHGYQLTPADVRTLGRADVVVSIGLGLEASLQRAQDRLVPDRAIELTFADLVGINADPGHDHADHDDHEHHDHHALDPHLWLDPQLAAAFVREAGAQLNADADAIDAQVQEILAVDEACRIALQPFEGSAIVTHHASLGRFAERYGLRVAEVIRPVGGIEPTPAELARVRDAIEREGVSAIFVEPQFDSRLAERIASDAGVRIVSLDPLGSGDWFAMMRTNLDALTQGLESE